MDAGSGSAQEAHLSCADPNRDRIPHFRSRFFASARSSFVQAVSTISMAATVQAG